MVQHRDDQPRSAPVWNKVTELNADTRCSESPGPCSNLYIPLHQPCALPISGIKATLKLTLSPRADILVLAPAPVWCPWPLWREARTHVSQKAAVPGARLHGARRLWGPTYRPCDSGHWDLSPDLSPNPSRDVPGPTRAHRPLGGA